MTAFHWNRILRLVTFAASLGLSATVATAQNDAFQPAPFGPPEQSEAPESWESTPPRQGQAPPSESAVPRAGGDTIDAFQVRMAESEYLSGRLRVLDPYSHEMRGVRRTDVLIIQEGEVVSRAQTGVDGVAQIKNLPEGKYSVVALGPDGMAAFGFEVLPAAIGTPTPAYRFDTLLVPNVDVTVAQRTMCEKHAPAPLSPAHPPVVGPVGRPLPPIPAPVGHGVIQSVGTVSSVPVDDSQHFAVENVSAPLKGQPILVRSGETGVGQLVILDAVSGEPVGLANARLSFIRAGQVLGNVRTDEQGYCGVVGLEDGVYSMVGVGENGFIALGVRVETSVPTPAPDATASAGEAIGDEYVSTLQYGYGRGPAGWRVAGAHSSALGFAPGFACGGCGEVGCGGACGVGPCGGACGPMAGYGFGGCGGFGGGFGGGGLGGGGLLGALVGAGLGAAIGAAVGGDDDDNGGSVSPGPGPDDDNDNNDDDGNDDDDDDDDDDPGPTPPNSPYMPPNQ